ncbi:MAG: hypothetical protein AAF442_09455 [Pseudomonadota bacterium]
MPRRREMTGQAGLFDRLPPLAKSNGPAFSSNNALSCRARISLAVAQTLDKSPHTREQIAQAMSDLLNQQISKTVLDGYASPARESNVIPADRAAALVRVTGDEAVIRAMLVNSGRIVVDARYEHAIGFAQACDQADKARASKAHYRRLLEQGS